MNYIARLFKVFRCLIPSKLPIGKDVFNTWAEDIFSTFGLRDSPSNRQTLATLVMHLGPTVAYKPKIYFALASLKSMANETAFETIQSLRKEEQAYIDKHMGNGKEAPAPETEPQTIM